MRMRSLWTALGVVALAACDQSVVQPAAEAPAPPVASGEVAASVDGFEPSPQHVIFAKSQNLPGVVDAVRSAGGEVIFQHQIGFVFARGLDEAGAELVAGVEGVDEIAPDEWFSPGIPGDPQILEAGIASPGDPAGAAAYARQWNMRAIDAPAAWDAGRLGSPDVTVAILDTGIDYQYPDLQGRVDLARSVSFVPDDDFFASIFFPDRDPVTDLHYHGTHVAATAVSNAFVLAGVTSGATLMGVKTCSFITFACSFGAVISGLLHATDNGADVLNLSLGGAFSKAGNGRFVGFINEVYNYIGRAGATVVVSAGNDGADLDRIGNIYKTYCDAPGVLCVSATGPTSAGGTNGPWENVDALAGYSNFGRSSISVAAPGGTGAGLVWAGCSTSSLVIPPCQTGIFVIGLGGTSMAAPHVSGLAALVVEDVGRRPGRVKSAIQQGADDLGQPGTDKAYGKGRINVAGTVGLN